MEDFKILLQGVLDKSKTQSNIESELNNLKNLSINISHIVLNKSALADIKSALSTSKITLDVSLAPDKIQRQVQRLGQSIKSNSKGSIAEAILNPSDLDKQQRIYESKIYNSVKKMSEQMKKTLSSKGYTDITINGVEKANGQVKSLSATVTDANGVIKQLQFELAKVKFPSRTRGSLVQTDDVKIIGQISGSVAEMQSKLDLLESKWREQGILTGEFTDKVKQLETELANVSSKGDMTKYKTSLQAVTAEANKAYQELNSLNHFKSNILPQIKDNMGSGYYNSQVQQQIEKYQRLGVTLTSVQNRINELEAAERHLNAVMGNSNSSLEQQRVAYQKFQAALKNTNASNSLASSMYMTRDAVEALIAKLQTFLANNTAMTSGAKNQISGYISQLQNAATVTKAKGNEITTSVRKVEAEMRGMGKLGDSFFQTIKKGMSSFAYWTSATSLIMTAVRKTKEAIISVKELDTALVDLKKTTSMTASQLDKFYLSANVTAKQMGVTTKEIIEQASAWSRLGYSTAEAATKMAEYSSQFAAISPDMDTDAATNGLVSIMKAFDIEPDNVLDGIMSKVNAIGNTAATSNGEIVNMLKKSSSAMKEANNTLEETIALETAAVEITRDDDSVGTAFKTVAMRLRGKLHMPSYNENYMLCA